MKYLAYLAVILALAACVTPQTKPPAEQAIAYWQGRSIDDVIAAWGPPTDEKIAENSHLYIWEASHYDQRYYPANLDPSGQAPFRRDREELACKGVFDVDEEGMVTKADWQGYECHFLP